MRGRIGGGSRVPGRSQKIETFGQVVGGVIHDVNGLLSIAQRSSAKLRELLPDDPEAHDRLHAVETAIKRAAALNRGLLEGRTTGADHPSTDIASRIADLADLLMCAVKDGVELTTAIEPGLPPAEIEPYEVDRIVTNLVRNACDVVVPGGRIEISAATTEVAGENDLELAPGRYLVVGVFDTGPGIAPEHVDQLFAPFFTTKPDGKGTGLGLTSVDWLVRRRAGAVRVLSRPKTSGTLFEVFLRAA